MNPEEEGQDAADATAAEALADKRKRLLRKMEISMQVWSQHQQQLEEGGSASGTAPETASSGAPLTEPDPDDSGPYERIPGDTSEEETEDKVAVATATATQYRKFGELGRMQCIPA